MRRDRPGGQGRQSGGVPGRVDPQVPHPAGRFHRGHRRADADLEGQAQGGRREVRQRHRRALRESPSTSGSTGQQLAEPLRLRASTASCRRPIAGPRRPSRAARSGIGEQVADRRRDRTDVPAVDHHARLAVADGFRCPAGPARDDGHAASPTPPGRRCRGPRRPARRRGCGTASRTRRPSRGVPAVRRRARRR